mmetsp:Transcript_36678/g.56339  ORF Transcript_36678/g.56339 Transcript_36678/m.56339 type:complete len:230 (+) Transcript_36678:89-778(+)|eukprot:CAMPEP_0118684836 /NCGR_PEP_ID=MMETSP0800-20121206/6880_1 /TAXON_ID=210618 ORGANISM="Striatella unipunctata, Strain CCMP2910" /NCGR_SAMPLE_ID=MMETSP0800 /ASSEMBLY_ACC=CAM_ASM_000638 /LENGTH=229 /DNA_ID=CAMNT_0006581617 /DNA_START=64 /DNA_END=753 /DNA_ORIENTATION=+
MVKKIAIIVTSAAELMGHPTGFWVEELACPYYLFKEAGYEIVIASPAGGPCPIDKNSMAEGFFTEHCKTFMHDGEAVGMLSHSTKVADLDLSTIDALYMVGGHGTCIDFVNNAAMKNAIETIFASADKVVAADCHGPICLADCVKPDGTPLVAGKRVTGFANSEEDAVQLTAIVPFLIETRFVEQGALYEKGGDWQSKVCVDGNLVTGQNPQSSEECAKAVIKLLNATA